MPEIRAFRGVRYDTRRRNGDVSPLIAPPYDVLDERDRDALLKKDQRNLVAVDLPHIPPKNAGPAEVYARAAGLLHEWLATGVLMRESGPALYVYHQLFTHEGKNYTRRMFIACVRLSPFSEGSVLPHEQTFGGPKEDRLALMKATRCQLSPIFGLYSDPADEIGRTLTSATSKSPDAVGTMEGVENRMWVVPNAQVIERVGKLMRDKKVYIADGHHRYGTALMYREWLASERNEPLSDTHPANYVMFVLASMDDPGCLILPYHRALGQIDEQTLAKAWANAAALPADSANADIRLWDSRTGRETALRFVRRDILRKLEPGQPDAWYDLDYAYLHRYLVDELLAKHLGHAPKVHYAKSADQARAAAKDDAGVALLMKATPMAHLRAVSESGGLMPQKSTYFAPKLATGMTMYMLE